MDVVGIFKDSIEVAKKSPLICGPTVAVGIVRALVTMALFSGGMMAAGMTGQGMDSPAGAMGAVAVMAGVGAIIGIVFTVLGLIAHGMTVGMANEALDTGKTSIDSGISMVMGRLPQLVVAALLVGLAVGIGMMLLIIPGLIAAFFFMFTFVIVVLENSSAVDAMKKSVAIVKANLNDLVMLFLGIIAAGVVVALVGFLFAFIPLIGQLINSLLSGVLAGIVTIAVVKVYKGLNTRARTETS
ncbi:MAG: hypothetical protein HZB33_14430 [Nitrospirae bacterium]|nr:hypothetical protein [Nitrospirota bacterium]